MKLTKYFVMFAFVSVVAVTLAAPTSFAQQAPEEDELPLAPFVLPAVCQAPAPDVSAPGIHFAPTTPTNNPVLQWNWTFEPEPLEGEAPSYGYAIYNGATLQTPVSPIVTANRLTYNATDDGTYSLYLWTGEGESSYCSVSSITLDKTPPDITNSGYTLNGKTGTPQLVTHEAGLTYGWAVNNLGNGVDIDNLAALNPLFTFSLSGTYNFTLTATDSFGNLATTSLTIVYKAPLAPPPIDKETETISEETIPDPIQEYTPIEEAVQIAYSEPSPSGDGKLPPVVDASIYSSTAEGREALNTDEKEVAGVVTAGQDGWRILGISWYWWMLISAVVAASWLWVVRAYRTSASPDDV